MMSKVHWFVLVSVMAALVAGGAAGYAIASQRTTPPDIEVVVEKTRDTIWVDKPVYTSTKFLQTILLPLSDTVRVRDTLYAPLPIEEREYRDSLYYAVVSGYKPVLEHLELYPETTVATRTVRIPDTRKWGFGLQAGYGMTDNGLSAYVGIGVTYNIIKF